MLLFQGGTYECIPIIDVLKSVILNTCFQVYIADFSLNMNTYWYHTETPGGLTIYNVCIFLPIYQTTYSF